MATHRHYRATVVVATAVALMAGAAPARAAVPHTQLSASATHAKALAQHRAKVQQRYAVAAHRRAISRLAAARAAAARLAAAHGALPAGQVAPASFVTTVTPTSPAAPTGAPTAAAPAPTTPAVTAPAGSPSGESAPRGNLPGWTQTYVEDFNQNVATGSFPGVYTDHWYAYSDGIKDTSKNGTYMPSKVLSVHDGVLDYAIRTEGGQHLVSAPVLKDTYGQVYGRYSVRFRSDSLPGYKNAWLLWPDSERWPTDGEIDFPEGDLNGTINGFAHYASSGGGQDQFSSGASFNAWHTATIEWLPGKVTFSLDGKVLGSSTQNVPTTAMHWVMQTETALSGGAPAAGVAGHVLVDWVALYKRA